MSHVTSLGNKLSVTQGYGELLLVSIRLRKLLFLKKKIRFNRYQFLFSVYLALKKVSIITIRTPFIRRTREKQSKFTPNI